MSLRIQVHGAELVSDRILRQVLAAELARAAEEGHYPDDSALHLDAVDATVELLRNAREAPKDL